MTETANLKADGANRPPPGASWFPAIEHRLIQPGPMRVTFTDTPSAVE